MNTEHVIDIAAPANVVWQVYAAVDRWPDWTESVTRVEALDELELAVGHRYAITQPRFPRLVWEVTALEPGVSWTWHQRSPGGLTVADHELEALDAETTRVRQRIDQRGPIGSVVGLLARRLTRRYLDLEARGLKAAAEAAHRVGVDGS